jgi:hypothetical protein
MVGDRADCEMIPGAYLLCRKDIRVNIKTIQFFRDDSLPVEKVHKVTAWST